MIPPLSMVLAVAAIAFACSKRAATLTVGSSFALINKLANSDVAAIGDLSVESLNRFSSSEQRNLLATELLAKPRAGSLDGNTLLVPQPHSKWPMGHDAANHHHNGRRRRPSDCTYVWPSITKAYSDSSWINLLTQRSPQPSENFA
jgi:hypothetical protein